MREIVSWMIDGFAANAALQALVGHDNSDPVNYAIFDLEAKLAMQNIPYPHLTVSRVSTARPQRLKLFDEQPDTAGQFDCPVIGISGWSQETRDQAYQVYLIARSMLLGEGAMFFASQYFSGYKIVRNVERADLYDREAQAYRVYGEFSMWAQLTQTAQPY